MNFDVEHLVNTGVNVFTVYLVIRLLGRIDQLTDRLLERFDRADAQRQALLHNYGIDPDQLPPLPPVGD